MKTLLIGTALTLPLFFTGALAQVPGADDDAAGTGFALPAPAVPSTPYPGDAVEPEVTITETETEVIYEYRIKGKLYMVKIDPLVGAPYYLFDTDGDGELDAEEDRGPNLSVPQWLLFSW